MKWQVVSVGKPSFSWAAEGVEMYRTRLERFTRIDMKVVKKGNAKEFEDAAGSDLVLALDERGESLTTRALAARVAQWEQDRVKGVTVCIGGADGLPGAVRTRADACLNLGRLTLMHELALLAWMEQLYRVHTLNAGHPYHR